MDDQDFGVNIANVPSVKLEITNRRIDDTGRCGIVLAGGEGKRLRSFIQRLRGDALPKQYVNFIGTRSMLQHTLHRAEKLIFPERLFTVVTRDHLRFSEVRRQLSGRPRGTIVVQPENKDTGPGLLLPLVHLLKRHPDSTVVVFPTDHFILEESLFMVHVELACQIVERDSSRFVLLGMEPDGPDTDYGYILPGTGATSRFPARVCEISRFIEKPRPEVAQELSQRGALWNTMVLVFKPNTLIQAIGRITPTLHHCFARIARAVGSRHLMAVTQGAYREMQAVNFSTGLLEVIASQSPSPLSVLPVHGVHWSDWGSAHRLIGVLRQTGYLGRLNGTLESGPSGIPEPAAASIR